MSTGQTYNRGNVRSGPSQYRDSGGTLPQFKIPQGSLFPDRAPFEASEIPHSLFDILVVFGALVLTGAIGIAVAFSFFYFLFL